MEYLSCIENTWRYRWLDTCLRDKEFGFCISLLIGDMALAFCFMVTNILIMNCKDKESLLSEIFTCILYFLFQHVWCIKTIYIAYLSINFPFFIPFQFPFLVLAWALIRFDIYFRNVNSGSSHCLHTMFLYLCGAIFVFVFLVNHQWNGLHEY
jgi:hypothetical protein